MSVRITRQHRESTNDENISDSTVLLESTLILTPDQSQTPFTAVEQPLQSSTTVTLNDFERSSSSNRPSTTHRVHVPVRNASSWFNGPDMQHERADRMSKVFASLVRRSCRSLSSSAYVHDRGSITSTSTHLQNAACAQPDIALIARSRPLPRCSARTIARLLYRKSPDDPDPDQHRPIVRFREHRTSHSYTFHSFSTSASSRYYKPSRSFDPTPKQAAFSSPSWM